MAYLFYSFSLIRIISKTINQPFKCLCTRRHTTKYINQHTKSTWPPLVWRQLWIFSFFGRAKTDLLVFMFRISLIIYICQFPKTFNLFGFPIFSVWAYPMKIILETRRAHYIRYLRFYSTVNDSCFNSVPLELIYKWTMFIRYFSIWYIHEPCLFGISVFDHINLYLLSYHFIITHKLTEHGYKLIH
jgi:hypothetical protein